MTSIAVAQKRLREWALIELYEFSFDKKLNV